MPTRSLVKNLYLILRLSMMVIVALTIITNVGCSDEDPTALTGSSKRGITAGKRSFPDRLDFSQKLAQIPQHCDDPELVKRLLGDPDHIRRAPEPVPVPTDEIWCYGMDGPGTLATLGAVCFRGDQVIWVAGGRGTPPAAKVIGENELRASMQILHPGPEHSGYNDPLHLIRVTNYLQPLGKQKALAIVGEYARIHDVSVDETWIFLLLRTLFDAPQPPGHMPQMRIGAMSPSPPDDLALIPRFPIVIVDDIPFSLLWGVALAGSPQPVSDHVAYFQKNGTMRASRLNPPDDPYPAYKKLLDSKEWQAMAEANDDPRNLANYAGHSLLQVLTLARTAYDPPMARQPRAYPKTSDYERYHKAYLELSPKWDDELQMYVRQDGTHGEVGHLANIYK